ncbi:hypothetical protein M0P98_06010 [bacterium]|nr:hypothetical protein [bacterium]
MKFKNFMILASALFLIVVVLSAQENMPSRRRTTRPEATQGSGRTQQTERTQRPDRTGGQRTTPQQASEMYMNRIKNTLEISDEEWEVVKPKVEKVRTAQMNTQRAGGMRAGRRTAGGTQVQVTPFQKAYQELQAVLGNKDSSPKDISTKLANLREARKTNEAELAQARKELKEILTQRQEAQLVLNGLLE